jgi:hypothetical protein
MQPVSLPHNFSEVLKKNGHVRTPEEHLHHLLHNTPVSEHEETLYSSGVKRALSAALALDDKTKRLRLIFKSGAKSELDLLLDGSDLLINYKWLDFQETHRQRRCWLSRTHIKASDFPCDHVINHLYDHVLCELKKLPGAGNELTSEVTISMRLRVHDHLRQMPRMIKLWQGKQGGELEVDWYSPDAAAFWRQYGVDLQSIVTLHRESTCFEKKSDILSSGGKQNPPNNKRYS